MKKNKYLIILISTFVLFLLFICYKNNQKSLDITNLENYKKIIMLIDSTGNPDLAVKYKITENQKDIDTIIKAIKKIRIKKEIETIYGGLNWELWFYNSNEEIIRITIHENGAVSFDTKTYDCNYNIDFEKLYDSINAEENKEFIKNSPSN